MKIVAVFVLGFHLLLAQDSQVGIQAPFDFARELQKARTAQDRFLGTSLDRFEAKHLYHPIENGEISSFEMLTSSRKLAEEFLVDLNLQLYQGGILPSIEKYEDMDSIDEQKLRTQIEDQIKKFIELKAHNRPKKAITIVDTNTETLMRDVWEKFEAFKQTTAFNTHFRKSFAFRNFDTENPYTVTHIVYKKETQAGQEWLVMYAYQFETKITIGVNKQGIPVHLEEPLDLKGNAVEICRIDKTRLIDIAVRARKFWNVYDGLESNIIRQGRVIRKNSVFESTRRTVILGQNPCTSSGRRKRSTALSCPTKFLVDYTSSSKQKQKEILDMIVSNREKLFSGTEPELNFLQSFFERELMTNHFEKLQNIKDTVMPTEPFSNSERVLTDFFELEEKIKDLGSDVKLSHSKTSQKLRSLTSSNEFKTSLRQGASVASGLIGVGFMAKTIATGIIHGDTTSLAIVGARVGYEVVTSGIEITSTIIKQATAVGKATTQISRVAGPVGDIADIGLSVWSLVKSGQALHNATNKYDKNAAIVDIVSNSIDIVVSSVVATLSIAFPPFAPLFALAGIVIDFINQLGVALFQAGNEVRRINSEIPLRDSEKRQVFESRFFDIFGTRKPDYIDYLVAEKQANDAVVKTYAKFLEDNQEFRGIVFPSMTLTASGKCELRRQHCRARMIGGRCLAGQREEWQYLAKGCEWNRPCGGYGNCNNFYKELAKTGRDYYECINCGAGPDMKFDAPQRNSFVDFRATQSVYLERAVPSNVQNAAFRCKPGSKTYRGLTVSQDKATNGYLCENSIGLLQPSNKRKSGQIMLFKLEDGNDQIYLNKNQASSPNMFLMGNEGNKIYEGGYDKNEFVFNSNCSNNLQGRIVGGPKSDSITLGEYCAKNQRITMDFRKGTLRSQSGKLSLSVSQIEQIVGREKQGESILAGCFTTNIIGRGGSPTQIDDIKVPDDSICKFNITILATHHTSISVRPRRGNIVIPVTGMPSGLKVDVDLYPKAAFSTTIIFLHVSSSQATLTKFINTTTHLEIGITANRYESTFQFSFMPGSEEGIALHFTELPDPSPMSILYVTPAGGRMFYHALPKMSKAMYRKGNPFTENVFEISGSWSVTGGNASDDFVLSTLVTGTLDGGPGTDTIRFHPDFTQSATIHLQTSQFRSIENVFGTPLVPLNVFTNCNTQLVSTQGGSESTADTVTIRSMECRHNPMQTQIIGTGYTNILIEGKVRNNDSVSIIADGTSTHKLNLSLSTESHEIENIFVNILSNNFNWEASNIYRNNSNNTVSFQLIGIWGCNSSSCPLDKIEFYFKQDPNDVEISYITSPFIQISVNDSRPGVLLIEQESLVPQIHHVIAESETQAQITIQGISKIKNFFRLAYSPNCSWTAIGGKMNDLFLVSPRPHYAAKFSVDGFEGENTLLLEAHKTDFNETFEVNLIQNSFGYESRLTGRVTNIHHVVGRTNAPDNIFPSCETKSIAGRSGYDKNLPDRITIYSSRINCVMDLTTVIDHYTFVRNNATKGKFVYIVNDLTTSEIQINSTSTSTHYFQFSFHPWSQITQIGFDPKTAEMMWIAGHEKSKHLFKMEKSNSSHDYINPIFNFSPTNMRITSEIQVGGNGLLYSTVTINQNPFPQKIQALPVHLNRFIINVTQINTNSAGAVIEGCSDNRRCLANQFFIVDMGNTTFSVLDGGTCHDKRCTNYLSFSNKINAEILVDLDSCSGFAQTSTGDDLISRLQNIHEFHGNRNATVIVDCDTRQVSGVTEVIVKDKQCEGMDLIVGLENNTTVRFEEIKDGNQTVQNGTIHYRFSQPTSFNPLGDSTHIRSFNHNYYLSFDLTQLDLLQFDNKTQRIIYKINGTTFSHKMIAPPDTLDQFYTQPRMLTSDGFRIQVSRDNSLWVTLGDTSVEISPSHLPRMEQIAKTLGVTMVIETKEQFFFIGNSAENERSVLQNMINMTSHLATGGSEDAIVEVVRLDHDIVLYTGFTEMSHDEWSNQTQKVKATIDLTDIIIPLRAQTQSKYVPTVNVSGDNLVISLPEFQNIYPANLVIINGTKPWVYNRLQLLLSSSLMDFKVLDKPTSSHKMRWEIVPRPVIIPGSISIYDISAEDLEDGQEIKLEAITSQQSLPSSPFAATQSGDDLVLTNIASEGVLEKTSVVISDFFQVARNSHTKQKRSLDESQDFNRVQTQAVKYFNNIKVSLPGLSLLLSDSAIQTTGRSRANFLMDFNSIMEFELLFNQTEAKLLNSMVNSTSGVRKM